MAYEQKPGDISIFPNDKKTSDNQPDMTGTLMDFNGKKWRVAVWLKNGTFYAGKISEPQIAAAPTQQAKPAVTHQAVPIEPVDSLPF